MVNYKFLIGCTMFVIGPIVMALTGWEILVAIAGYLFSLSGWIY